MKRAPVLLLMLALFAGCRHLPASSAARPEPGPNVPTPDYYDAPGPVPEPLAREIVWRRPHSEMHRILLPPRVIAAVAEVPLVSEPIEILHVRPRPAGSAPRPLVLMFPILSNGTKLMCEFATGFTRLGYDVAIVPRKELAFDPHRSIEQAEEELRVLLMRGRQATDWLVRQPGVDGRRLGICGVSAGGILGAAMMGADPRFQAGVFILAGGPMADVMVDTTEGEFADKMPEVQEVRGWSKDKIRATLRGIIRTDPLVLAPRVPREDVMMFIALRDDSVPTRNQIALWEALGRPEAHLLPTGHYTSFYFFFLHILIETKRFLGSRLGTACARGTGRVHRYKYPTPIARPAIR